MNKIRMGMLHFVPFLIGFPRYFIRYPVFSLRLLFLRTIFFLTNKLLFPLRDVYGFTISNHHMLISYWAFFVERELYQAEWVNEFRLAKQPVAIDVGANAGVFSHWLVTLNSDVKLYMYEPLPMVSEHLQDMKRKRDGLITFYSAACGDTPGNTTLFFSVSGDTDASLISTGSETMKMNVPMVTLDTTVVDNDIFIIKIDTQGYELNVLLGGVQTVENARYLMLELMTTDELDRVTKHLGAKWKRKKISAIDYLFYR